LIRPPTCVPPKSTKLTGCRSITQYIRAWKALPFQVDSTQATGRRAVATRTIPEGTFLFAEHPVAKVQASNDKLSNAAAFAVLLLEGRSAALRQLVGELCDSTPTGYVANRSSSKKLKKVLQGVDPTAAARFMGIYLCNSHTMVGTEEAGIFPLTAMLNHSCAPNCVLSADTKGTLCVVATEEVQAGEELTVAYIELDEEPFGERQEALMESFHFTCQCDWCTHEQAQQATRRKRRRPREQNTVK